MKKIVGIMLVLMMAVFCLTGLAEITEYEAIENVDGVNVYSIMAGHSPEAFGSICLFGADCTLLGFEMEGEFPDGLFPECIYGDETEIRISGRAERPGQSSCAFTIRYTEGGEEKTYRTEYVFRVLEGPVREALTFSDGQFHLASETERLTAGVYLAADGYLELYENGRGTLNVAGHDWPVTWDEQAIYDETGSAGRYTYLNGHLSFGWEGGDGFYTYEYDRSPDAAPQAEVPGTIGEFFDETEEEPYFVYHENGRHYGYEDDYWDGCSVWCAVSDYRIAAEASSTLAPQGAYSYGASNVYSGDRGNAWIEGAEGYGIGEYIEMVRSYDVCDGEYGVDFQELCLVNGYARSPEAWAANSRVKQLRLYVDNVYVDTFTLQDTMKPQYFDLTRYGLHADSRADSVWRFEIASVYPGDEFEDTAITGIEVKFWTPNH